MAIRTDKTLDKLLQAFKEQRQKQKEQEAKRKQKQYQLKLRQKQREEKLKIQEEKKQKLIALQALVQNNKKQDPFPITEAFQTYNSKWHERFTNEEDLYLTREELEAAEPNIINWEAWERVSRETQEEIKQLLQND